MNLYLLSFGDNLRYRNALIRCNFQAQNFKDNDGKNVFRDIFCVNEYDIENNFPDFFEEHGEFIENNVRGYGYWIWKPYLIKKLMETLDDDDVILYIDSGCQLNYNGIERLEFYYQKALEYGGVCFRLTHHEFKFTKMDTYRRVFPTGDEFNNDQFSATSMLLKCSDENKKFVDEWYSICVEKSYHYVDDTPSVEENSEIFVDHRHDQSIFSLLVKRDNMFCQLDDETFWDQKEWKQRSVKYPIWATRNSTSNLINFY